MATQTKMVSAKTQAANPTKYSTAQVDPSLTGGTANRPAAPAPVTPTVEAPKQYNAGGGVISPYNKPITSAAMTPAPAVALPTPTTPTTTAPVEAAVNASTANVAKSNDIATIAANTAPAPTQSDNLAQTMRDVLGIQDQITTETASVDRAAQDKARMDADQYTSQIEQEALATRRATESLQKNNPQGLFGGALQDEVNRLNRDSLSKQADLAILQNSALRNFDTAKSIADRQLELKLEPLKTKLDNLKFFYGENKDILSKADDRAYTELIKTKDREYNKIAASEKELSDVKISALKSAAEQGAPASVQNAIQNAKTPAEAITAAGQYAGNILDTKLKNAQIANIYSEIGKRNQEAAKLKKEGQPVSFVTPPIINPNTGKVDPVSQLSTLIKSTEGKTSDNLKNVLGVVSAAQSLASGSPDGKFEGIGPIALSGPLTSKKGQANKTNIEAVNLKIQQWASGASLTPEQTKKVQNIAAQVSNNDSQVRNKTNAIVNFMLSQVRSDLASQGINYEPAEIDLFSDITTTSNDQFLQLLPTAETPQSTNLDFFKQYN